MDNYGFTFNAVKQEEKINQQVQLLSRRTAFLTRFAWGLVVLGCLVVVFGIYWYLETEACTSDSYGIDKIGDFMSGTVASLWSLAGLFFVYIAFLGQKQQSLLQQLEILWNREEIRKNYQEMIDQKAEMKAQNDTLRQQRFEHSFFQMLNVHISNVNAMDIRNEHRVVISTGRECFRTFYKKMKEFYSTIKTDLKKGQVESEGAILAHHPEILAFEKLYQEQRSDLSHYFTTLYHIFKFIKESDINNPLQYTSIVRAQLSSYELVILFYNCLHENGNAKFKLLAEEFSLFNTIDHHLLLSQDLISCYHGNARGELD